MCNKKILGVNDIFQDIENVEERDILEGRKRLEDQRMVENRGMRKYICILEETEIVRESERLEDSDMAENCGGTKKYGRTDRNWSTEK